ncbi:hypothetical protein IVB22_08695 [Bradyrhizobium sp. 190]|uniref:hypothetical protein n=1 Tax=Bradyrhizobium sp. 190 TaxID=2782658 RepID=UPI001FF8D74B|nr:hypothetical protein [Bradyrhizobium sp. 190]MCK1512655.1 hypothetical protein [Bradyrhizobium sp. 190]
MPPANPTPATATATTARINNDYLGLHCQVIDLDVISLGGGQWHSIRAFRRDSPTDRSDAGHNDDGTRQNIREHRAATHCNHEFSPSFEGFFQTLQKPQHLSGEVAWPFAPQTYAHLNSTQLVDQSGDSSGRVRVFSYHLARKTSASYGRSPFGSS